MRDTLRALYYPDFWVQGPTIKKSILLFDEIHFMDRPSFMFGSGGHGSIGMVGASSPMRQYEQSFRDEGVPLYVHEAPGGRLPGELLKAVEADLSDTTFMAKFQEGLQSSPHFHGLHIVPGNYGNGETHETIFQKIAAVDLHNSPSALEVFNNRDMHPFDYTTRDGLLKVLATDAAFCSVKMNFALSVGAQEGFAPLADASPYTNLLSSKYSRAVASASAAGGRTIAATDLSLAILDELVPAEILSQMTIGDTIKYRKESESARDAFLEHLLALQAKLGQIALDADYGATIDKIITTEIRPAAREFRNALDTICDKLFGKIKAAAILAATSPAVVQIFGDMTLEKLSLAVMPAAGYAIGETIGALAEVRAASRDCALSYLLDLEPAK